MRKLYYLGDVVEYWDDKWIVDYVDDSELDGYDTFTFSITPINGGAPSQHFSYSFHRRERIPTELKCLPIITPSTERLFNI